MKKIELLKALLESQTGTYPNWDKIIPVIKRGTLPEKDKYTLDLELPEQHIMFVFDESGDIFLGIVNWQE